MSQFYCWPAYWKDWKALRIFNMLYHRFYNVPRSCEHQYSHDALLVGYISAEQCSTAAVNACIYFTNPIDFDLTRCLDVRSVLRGYCKRSDVAYSAQKTAFVFNMVAAPIQEVISKSLSFLFDFAWFQSTTTVLLFSPNCLKLSCLQAVPLQ